ncbi:hypothetical protein GCM10009819_31110 [Agromyces tropicus]|uniref:Cell wall-binding repeat-containing protein n=1 Tax=Agromyces tropicus TaxID=555371 RepID=A0ABP5GB88_9MICO
MRRRHALRLLATGLALVVGIGALTAAPAEEAQAERFCDKHPRTLSGTVERISGADRFATAVAISKRHFDAGTCRVYVASGLDFPDALAGAADASGTVVPYPVLLVRPDSIPAVVAAELKRLDPDDIVVLGGTASVSDRVFRQLEGYAETSVMRVGGRDRYDTAVQMFLSVPTSTDRVYIASGQGFPDALAAGSLAGRDYAPLLLTSRYAVPEVVKEHLRQRKPKHIIIVGGTGAVSSAVESTLRSYASESVTRIAGKDRFATAVEVSKQRAQWPAGIAYVASGLAYPDALTATPAAQIHGVSVLLVAPNSIPAVVDQELKRLQPRHIVILGGTGAVSADVERKLQGYLVAP